MKQSLQEICEAQIRNETAMRKVAKIEYEPVLKLCAMMHVNAGREVNADRIRECSGILKSKGRHIFELPRDAAAGDPDENGTCERPCRLH